MHPGRHSVSSMQSILDRLLYKYTLYRSRDGMMYSCSKPNVFWKMWVVLADDKQMWHSQSGTPCSVHQSSQVILYNQLCLAKTMISAYTRDRAGFWWLKSMRASLHDNTSHLSGSISAGEQSDVCVGIGSFIVDYGNVQIPAYVVTNSRLEDGDQMAPAFFQSNKAILDLCWTNLLRPS